MTLWFRYVIHSKIPAYQAAGWTIDNDFSGSHHGAYAVIMRWVGEGEPEEPK